MLLKLLSTAAAGALDVWVGIITGVALGLPPALSGAVSIASALAGVTLVVAAGGRLRHLIYRSRRLAKRRERIERVWKRYGIPGVALQAPLLTGPLLATLLALALGAPARPLLLWMLASVVFWGAVLAGAAALGLSIFSGWAAWVKPIRAGNTSRSPKNNPCPRPRPVLRVLLWPGYEPSTARSALDSASNSSRQSLHLSR